MNVKSFFCYIFLLFICYACRPYSKEVEQALALSGDNKEELVKVLEYYRGRDELKFAAACFLIGNMPYHKSKIQLELPSYYFRHFSEICNFMMIFVGTYDYLMNTKAFGKNTYLHREPDFDGDAFFYKPGQGLVNGWKYKAGKIVATISPGVEGGSHITSTRGMYQDCSDECTVVARNDCWGEDYWDDELGQV